MRLDKSFKYYLSLFGAALAAVSSIPEVAACLAGPADIREKINEVSAHIVGSTDIHVKETKNSAKNMGEECIKFEADISKNTKEDSEIVDVGVLGCGEALICLEDDSSSTGARCVESVEVNEGGSCVGLGAVCGGGWVRSEEYGWVHPEEMECCEGKCQKVYITPIDTKRYNKICK